MTQPKTASKFTPGPLIRWEKENSEGTLISICRHIGPQDSADHLCVAEVRGKTPEEAEANVRLFIKAPEMYELLELVLLACRNPVRLKGEEIAIVSHQIMTDARRIKAEIDGEPTP